MRAAKVLRGRATSGRLAWLVAVTVLVVGCPAPVALALSGGRVYEMVTPVYKGGYGAKHIEAVAPGGESIAFNSPGAFAGAPSGANLGPDYVARRTASGWVTTSLVPPAPLLSYTVDRDVSSTLSSEVVLGKPGTNQEGAFQTGTEMEFLSHSLGAPDVAAEWELAGPVLKTFPEEVIGVSYLYGTSDLCHLIVTPAPITSGGNWLVPEEAGNTARQIYEVDRGCDGEPVAVQRVASNNKGKTLTSPACQADVGIENYEAQKSAFNAVADSGKEIFFTTGASGCNIGQQQLFVRLNGEKTLEVSKPLGEACIEVPCGNAETRPAADFVGASEDGATVYFTTAAPLEPATDKDSETDLYMAKIGCSEGESSCQPAARVVRAVVQASADPHAGEAAEVQGAVRLAPDGQRIYFVAHGDLLSNAAQARLAGEGRPVPHPQADNLYVHDSVSGVTAFIGDLCSEKERSGALEDESCPSSTGSDAFLWGAYGAGEEQTAGPDGRYLVFATYAQLTSDDTDAARDVYRYDAETEALGRVSLGEGGYDANGNKDLFDGSGNDLYDASIAAGHWGGRRVQEQYEMDNRAVSEDGSRIIFTTSEPLSPAATNGLANVYEWHQGGEGSVSLISGGDSEEPVEDAVISPDGNDVFFLTSQGLVPQDTDGAPDIYDARIGGGFSPPAVEAQPCEGDACQGPLTNPAPLSVPGSLSQPAGENLAAPRATTVKPRPKTKTKQKKKRKRRPSRRRRATKRSARRSK
jgi:hypothetical protein